MPLLQTQAPQMRAHDDALLDEQPLDVAENLLKFGTFTAPKLDLQLSLGEVNAPSSSGSEANVGIEVSEAESDSESENEVINIMT